MIKVGKYKHYKGGFYNVISFAKHSETLEELVVYQRLYGDYSIWVRPIQMFNEKVEFEGKTVLRFEFIGELQNFLRF
ncbi:DUF1653 domain-containing protein [Solitalea longa]|uniref:DUF1653 domain-containing protein n=1 Tax=Solitalea longa TaxID=2079460 RepID=A0A2S5A1I1_9SPHI|nr:DUF1653 domain-containing protein [Solitalea longa]POY36441.1 DUF1653 domain-containing protein [Solitalea longa]